MSSLSSAYARSQRAIQNVQRARQDAATAAATCRNLRKCADQLLSQPVYPRDHFATSVGLIADERRFA